MTTPTPGPTPGQRAEMRVGASAGLGAFMGGLVSRGRPQSKIYLCSPGETWVDKPVWYPAWPNKSFPQPCA